MKPLCYFEFKSNETLNEWDMEFDILCTKRIIIQCIAII